MGRAYYRPEWIARALLAALLLGCATEAGAAPTLASNSSQTFSVGQATTAASTITVTDDAVTPTITAASDLRIRIPAGLNMTWDTTVTTVTLTGTGGTKTSATLLAYEDGNKTAVLNVTTNWLAGDLATIAGLKFTSFTAVSAASRLELVTTGSGGATAATDTRSKTIQSPTPVLASAANQTFSTGWPSTAASNPTINDDPGVPTITAANDIRIRIPASFNMTWDTSVTTVTLSGSASGKVSTTLGAYEDSNKTLVLNVTSDFAAGQTLTIAGLKFSNFTAVSAADFLQLVVTGTGGATASLDSSSKTIQVPTANLASAASQTFIVGQASTAASNATVTDDLWFPTVTAANGLRIRIPAGLSMTWDTSITTVTLTGSAAGKVSTTLAAYEDANRTLVLAVSSNFAAADTLTVSGAKFNNFTASSTGRLELVTAGSGGATASSDTRSKSIGAPVLTSAANQNFTIGQASTLASTITVADDPNVTTITAANDLRIRIPATFNMTWDSSVTTVTLSFGGTAAGKVSTTLKAYEDGNHTAVLDVTGNFIGDNGDSVTISGLKFNNFTAASAADYLQAVVTGAGGATAGLDNRTKTIGGTKLYFHDAATTDTGTLPGAATLSATTPQVTAATAGTNRDMDVNPGSTQASATLTTVAQTTLQKNWFRRFLSRPLAAQTLPTGAWAIQGGATESSNSSNVLPWGAVLKVWRPSTGATVATLVDNTVLGTVEPATTETNISSSTASIGGVAVNAGDILVLELWAQNTQGNATARTNTIYYDGTTEGSTSSNAAFLQAPGAITFASGSGATGFKISYSNYGLFCLAQTVTITAVDGSGNAVSGYTGTVNLTTTTARGTWTKTAGNGTLNDSVPDDGAASYAWNGADTSATFALSYKGGGAVVTANAVDSVQPGIHDDGSQGAISFSPSGFTVTSAPFSNPAAGVPAFAVPQVAGNNVSVYLTAYGQSPTDASCGIITSYAGNKSLKFWSTYLNPASGTLALSVNGIAASTTEAGAASQTVAFTAGQALVTALYKDVGAVSLSMKDDTTGNPGLPNGIRGSTGSVVWRPYRFSVTNIKRTADNFANPAATTAGGTVFTGAGRTFTATVTALESGGNATPNFGQESPAESVRFDVVLVVPASGNAPSVAGTLGSFVNGVATGNAFSWSEVGIMQLLPRIADGDYLGAGDFVSSPSGNVGRFTPDHFATALNTPVFSTACAAGSFSYLGQPMTYVVAPVITATAQALGGTTTLNYTGSLMRLTNTSLTGRSYTPTPASPGLDLSGLPSTTADPSIADLGSGQDKLSFDAGSGLKYVRGGALAPFSANISLSINVIDQDGVTATNPVVFGSSTGIAFSTGATQYYGRLNLSNAVGSELLDLPVPLTTQYYLNSTQGFVVNASDSCTTAPAISLGSYQLNLQAGETCVRDSGSPGVSGLGCAAPAASSYYPKAAGGAFNLIFAAPGSGNSGAATVTATGPAWLQYLWNAASGVPSSPSAMATFGVFPGSAARIYQREVY